ncbi:tetratricopeptide repeat protein [Tenacibaculum sp. ZS6-P6]|uniref:tetratricopeptide repeat protein n=1 Tax=Tenacibaculum sp. ZS6-P6 TaxID=3447503 RepID=UPI003F9C3FB5
MKEKLSLIILIICLNISSLFSQVNMDKGFKMLETGDFKNAKLFFETVLKETPNNKTAKLCYGRALGLTGSTQEATSLFSKLLEKYPNDFEIKLNYAESLLWGKEYPKAKAYYTTLLKEQPNSFNALLGYANTLSNLKDYVPALEYVNKALEVSPNNPNAMVSRKFIRLGLADQLFKQEEHNKALSILEDNFKDFKDDKQSLQLQTNIYLSQKDYEKAKINYSKNLSTKKDSIISLNGLSLIAHLEKNDRTALRLSEKAIRKLPSDEEAPYIERTKERYVQALVWNKKNGLAKTEIQKLYNDYGERNWVHALNATLQIYRGNASESINYYQKILDNDTKSFDGNLGIANAFFANTQLKKTYAAVKKTLEIFPNQKDAISLEKKLLLQFTPHIKQRFNYSYDSGDNVSYASNTSIEYPLNTRFTLTSSLDFRDTENKNTGVSTSAINFNGGLNYVLLPRLKLVSSIGINKVDSENISYNQFSANLAFHIKPFNLQNLEIGYSKQLESFNADLLNRRIVNDNYYANYNINTNFNFGWFNQYFLTQLSDGNQRNLFFTSLYYNFMADPVLKGGLNYQFITFNQQVPSIYFSPEKFNNVEIFLELLKDANNILPENWYYWISGATGFQFIEDNSKQLTYRIQTRLGYKFSDRFFAHVFGQHTNIASATVGGFTFTNLGISLKWYFGKSALK